MSPRIPTRTATAALAAAFALLVLIAPPGARAATPSSGTATAAGDTFAWTGGPFTSVNASTGTCVEGVSCDTFTLELLIPEGKVARVDFRIEWQSSLDDFDLFVFDESGEERDFSAAGGTTSEQVAIDGLEAGLYRVVVNAFATANASYSGFLAVEALTDPPADSIGKLIDKIEFNEETMADFSAVSGEPVIRVSPDDEIFVSVPFGLSTTQSLLWKSIDGGRSFIPLGTPITRDSVTAPGGGDSHLDFDGEGRLYFVDLSGACVTAAVSLDGGNTFPPERTNPVTCLSEEHPEAAADDRQWVGAFGDGIGYATWRNLVSSPFWLFKTEDGGLSWDAGTRLGTVSQSGPFQVDKSLRRVTVEGVSYDAILSYQVYYQGTAVKVFRILDRNDGSPLIVDDFLIADPGVSVGNVFPQLAIDTAGNLYAAWSQGATDIYLATSTDRGATWSEGVRVNDSSGTNIMPWIVAGDPGRVDLVWYRSPLKGNPNVPESTWDILMAQSVNALKKKPKFRTAKVNQTTIHRGEICLRGLACDLDGSDRSFLEFPSVSIDSEGAAVVTFNHNTNQVAAPYVMVSKQVAGPSLYESVRRLDGAAAPGGSDADEAGDARFPDHGPAIGPNVPALDIRSVTVTDDAEALTVTLELADLQPLALAFAQAQTAADGLLFLVQWNHDDRIRWVGAEVRSGEPSFLTGTLGSIDTLGPKFITYRPDLEDSAQVEGSMDESSPGTLSFRVPRALVGSPADGARLSSVTAYAFSERGPLVPESSLEVVDSTSLPIQVDASAAFHHVVGD